MADDDNNRILSKENLYTLEINQFSKISKKDNQLSHNQDPILWLDKIWESLYNQISQNPWRIIDAEFIFQELGIA